MQMPNILSCLSLSLYLTAARAWNEAYNITTNQRAGTHGATHWLSSCLWFIFPCYVNPYRALPLHLPPGSLLFQLFQGRCRGKWKDTFNPFYSFQVKGFTSTPLNRLIKQTSRCSSKPSLRINTEQLWALNCGT